MSALLRGGNTKKHDWAEGFIAPLGVDHKVKREWGKIVCLRHRFHLDPSKHAGRLLYSREWILSLARSVGTSTTPPSRPQREDFSNFR